MTRRQTFPGQAIAVAAALLMSLGFFLLASAEAAADSVLDRIRTQSEIRLAYREDAAPFSFVTDGNTEPQGYSLDLCRAIATSLKAELKLSDLKITYVKVTPENR